MGLPPDASVDSAPDLAPDFPGDLRPDVPPDAPPIYTSTAAGIFRLGDSYRASTGYERYQYMIVNSSNAAQAGALPTTSFISRSAAEIPQGFSLGVSYEEAMAGGWLLKDASGNYVKTGANEYLGDIGNAGYRQTWLNNVSALLASTGCDGVYISAVVANPGTITSNVFP